MTFTYDLSDGFSDLTRVRQALGDTDAAAPKFADEEIEATVAEQGDWRLATLALIDSLLARLSLPNYRADWLQVDHASARKGYQDLRAQLARRFGMGATLSAGAVHTYRADSAATEAPDYSKGRP